MASTMSISVQGRNSLCGWPTNHGACESSVFAQSTVIGSCLANNYEQPQRRLVIRVRAPPASDRMRYVQSSKWSPAQLRRAGCGTYVTLYTLCVPNDAPMYTVPLDGEPAIAPDVDKHAISI